MIDTILASHDARTLAQAIVNTLHEPFVVLDTDLRVIVASRSFYETFKVEQDQTHGRLLYDLGDGQWNIAALRELLETIIPRHATMDNFEVEHDFPGIGPRTMLLNARKVVYETSPDITILLAFIDVTARRAGGRGLFLGPLQTEELLGQKRVLLREMDHRVSNTLQLIGSILRIQAKAATSEEARLHLLDARARVLSVSTVQSLLHASEAVEQIEAKLYFEKLCAGLAASMIPGEGPPFLRVVADAGSISSLDAVNMGLIITELVINALKYAFPTSPDDATVVVSYERQAAGWILTVSDNGVGKGSVTPSVGSIGLGTAIVLDLAKQIKATLLIADAKPGVIITLTRINSGAEADLIYGQA